MLGHSPRHLISSSFPAAQVSYRVLDCVDYLSIVQPSEIQIAVILALSCLFRHLPIHFAHLPISDFGSITTMPPPNGQLRYEVLRIYKGKPPSFISPIMLGIFILLFRLPRSSVHLPLQSTYLIYSTLP